MQPITYLLGGLASLAAFGALAADAPALPALTASQIVDKNVAARGGLAGWRALETLMLSGQLDAGGKNNAQLPFELRMKRTHKSRLEIRFGEQTAVQVYDGAHGWKVRPFLNRNDAEPFSPEETRAAAAWTELDGPLVDFASKGTKVESAGTETVEGKSTYKLKLTLKDGTVRQLWIDAGSFLETKIDGEPRKMDGKVRRVSVFYRDYRPEAGLMMPHTLETVVDGVKQNHKMTIERVAVNQPMQEALFQKPQLAAVSAPAR